MDDGGAVSSSQSSTRVRLTVCNASSTNQRLEFKRTSGGILIVPTGKQGLCIQAGGVDENSDVWTKACASKSPGLSIFTLEQAYREHYTHTHVPTLGCFMLQLPHDKHVLIDRN